MFKKSKNYCNRSNLKLLEIFYILKRDEYYYIFYPTYYKLDQFSSLKIFIKKYINNYNIDNIEIL
jgi:hypothetical protein